MEGKERILTELKSKIGDPNVASKFSNLTDRTLTEYVDKLYPSLGESFEPDEAFYGTHVGILETLAGNIRYAASSAVEDYKKKNPVKNVVEPPKPNSEPQPAGNEALELINSLKAEVERIKLDKTNSEKKAQLEKNISEAKTQLEAGGASNSKVLGLALRLIPLTGEEQVEDIVAKAKAEYDKQVKELYGDSYYPDTSYGQGSPVNSFAAYKAQKQKEGKLPS